jgi:hypothetical protein
MTLPLPAALRAAAEGLYPLQAATGRIIAHGTWPGRDDFARFIHHGTGADGGWSREETRYCYGGCCAAYEILCLAWQVTLVSGARCGRGRSRRRCRAGRRAPQHS